MKALAYPSIFLTSLILAACGGGGLDASSSSEPMTPADATADTAIAPESLAPASTEDGISTVVAGVSAIAHVYVAATGSDANPGTQALPFKTILKASRVATPGTTIHVSPGVYSGGFITTASGTAGARIRYVSDTKWGAKIVPPANSTGTVGWYNRGNYVDIEGFEVNGQIYQGGTKWLTGIYTTGSYGLIRRNNVHDIATDPLLCSTVGGSAINADSYYGGANNDIISNVVHDIGSKGCIAIQGLYVVSTGNVINNLVYRIGKAGIHLWHDAHHINIINNTVIDSGFGIIVGNSKSLADYIVVSNNIVYNNDKGIAEQGKVGTHNIYTNNLVYQNGSLNWSLYSRHTGTVTADPQFVLYSATGVGDYRPRSTSPAVDAGDRTYAPTYDFQLNARPQGPAVDIGAYEYRY